MEVMQIVILVFVLLVAIYFIVNAFKKSNQLTKMAEGKTLQTIKAADLKNVNNSSNFTYSMWIYVDDWNYKFGSDKIVLRRGDIQGKPCPQVSLGNRPNTLSVNVSYYNTGSGTQVEDSATPTSLKGTPQGADAVNACSACTTTGLPCVCSECTRLLASEEATRQSAGAGIAGGTGNDANTGVHTCMVDNIPIQRWVNVIISLYGRTLDVYLDGKLVRTCVLPGVAKVNQDADIAVTPSGGFSGWTSTFKYLSNASNPQEAYNMYKDGFGGSILGNALSKYRVRFSLIKDNKENGSFEI
jgi:hypothetical protein